jgi:glyoxylase-like metal-dependent hydrolase (beta-lactamase superfamily II)
VHARTGARVWAHQRARFPHDVACEDGAAIELGSLVLHAIDAPGHAPDHLVFWLAEERVLFTGDVVIGRGTVVVAPPAGDMRTYQATLERLRRDFAEASSIFGGHGERLDSPLATLDAYIAHREAREREILAALAGGAQTIPQLVAHIYHATDRVLWPAAARQVLAYLIALEREGRVRPHALAREPNAEERAILRPDLSRLVDPAALAVAAAELGFGAPDEPLRAYERQRP